MPIGIDIDNTILDYSRAFQLAASRFLDEEVSPKAGKEDVKRLVTERLGNSKWTEIQGMVYANAPENVRIFDGFVNFLDLCQANDIGVTFVSHKTLYPVMGERKNLREPILAYLHSNRLIRQNEGRNAVVFCETLEEKISVINASGFDFFIDDLQQVIDQIDCTGIHLWCTCSEGHSSGKKGLADWTETTNFVFAHVK